MSYKTVANLKDSVSGILQGLNLNNVTNLFTAFERTARQLAQKISIPDAMGRYALTLYDGVINYAAPTDIFGSSLIDIQAQGITRNENDYVYKSYISDFDRTKNFLPNGTEVTFEWNKGVAIARIVSTIPTPRIELDPFTATTGWTASGSASGITLDSTVLYQQPGSLRFLLTGASTGILTKTIPTNDLTNYIGVGVVFLAIYLPTTETLANLTSISVKLGSSASAYYSVSATTGFLGAFVLGDWMLVALNLSGSTTTGSPDKTKITYAQISIATAGTISNFYIGDFWIALPTPTTLIYQTSSIFQASGQNPSASIVTVADNIILNDAVYAIYELECAVTIASQQGGDLSSGIVNQLNQTLNGIRGYRGVLVQPGLLDLYRGDNPNQLIRTIGNWYND